MADDGRCLVIETDALTGWAKRKSRALSRHDAEQAAAAWRERSVSRYRFEVRPVTAWLLDITTGDHHALFMMALETGLSETDLVSHEPPTVWVREDGQPGGRVWAYTRKGVSSPPEWLVKLCEVFEAAGFEAGIRRA